MSQNNRHKPEEPQSNPDFHGAALIDEEGNEIPITEDMVQEAFVELEQQSSATDEGS
ncbi:PA1571 family protein [Porticoccus sp.]